MGTMGKFIKRLNHLSRISLRRRLQERIVDFNNLNNQNYLLSATLTISQSSTLVSDIPVELNTSNLWYEIATSSVVADDIPQLEYIYEPVVNIDTLVPPVNETDFLNDSYELGFIRS